jgi:Protein of unknown function with PCYCGC motif
MKKGKKVNKGKKQGGTKRGGLATASLVMGAALLAGGAWVYTKAPNRSVDSNLKSGLKPASAYVRRETKTPLSPALFVGQTETAYRVAQEIPDVIDQMYCYCECDKHSSHVTLLSCYTDDHAANCDICQDEALEAARLMKQGYSVAEIRGQIDRKFSRL